ncbi:expressed unknown protein [Seminavis robusta]|uniref:Uncharacterized protein n=1 Tax=Seminavis robusta TaxID=568900 RepID=A0A9N8D4U0_9STRA|nr:expressed unknown protein [Seminavis robusta]|eukprot:Sro1_g000671.1  (129) ;mRNA; r:194729-195115
MVENWTGQWAAMLIQPAPWATNCFALFHIFSSLVCIPTPGTYAGISNKCSWEAASIHVFWSQPQPFSWHTSGFPDDHVQQPTSTPDRPRAFMFMGIHQNVQVEFMGSTSPCPFIPGTATMHTSEHTYW